MEFSKWNSFALPNLQLNKKPSTVDTLYTKKKLISFPLLS